jgi:8-oxo-dGTP diphosphatase
MLESPQVIRIVAGVVTDPEGRVLLVRKAGTTMFMLPGGKRCAGEDDLETLCREILEELGCGLAGASHLGRFEAPAANEPGATVEANLYRIELQGEPAPRAEIAELVWVDPKAVAAMPLAPLARDHVLPLVEAARRR